MLVTGLSLPVGRYVWSFSRSRQPLPGHGYVCLRKFAMNPLPLPTWRHGAGICVLGIRISGCNPSRQSTHRYIQREGESHANPAAHEGISRYHATPAHTHGAQERRFFGGLPLDWTSVCGKIADALNDLIKVHGKMAQECARQSCLWKPCSSVCTHATTTGAGLVPA